MNGEGKSGQITGSHQKGDQERGKFIVQLRMTDLIKQLDEKYTLDNNIHRLI